MDDSNYNDFSGECNETVDILSVMLHNDWTLMIKYTLKNSAFELDTILLNYTVDSQMFPNVSADFIGKHTVMQSGLHEFSANKGNSYKCTSKTTMTIQELVTLEFKNYQAQPFINPDSKSKDFDTGRF